MHIFECRLYRGIAARFGGEAWESTIPCLTCQIHPLSSTIRLHLSLVRHLQTAVTTLARARYEFVRCSDSIKQPQIRQPMALGDFAGSRLRPTLCYLISHLPW